MSVRIIRRHIQQTLLPMFGVFAFAITTAVYPAHAEKRAWDRVANIESAARRLAVIQRSKGTEAVLKFLSECYKTHTISPDYSQGVEACLAQDIINTKVLALIYSRLPPSELARMRMPSLYDLTQGMTRRVDTVFNQYKVTGAEAKTLTEMIDKHGFPLFLAAVFPNSKGQQPDAKPDKAVP